MSSLQIRKPSNFFYIYNAYKFVFYRFVGKSCFTL